MHGGLCLGCNLSAACTNIICQALLNNLLITYYQETLRRRLESSEKSPTTLESYTRSVLGRRRCPESSTSGLQEPHGTHNAPMADFADTFSLFGTILDPGREKESLPIHSF